jgi:hypothetical protein
MKLNEVAFRLAVIFAISIFLSIVCAPVAMFDSSHSKDSSPAPNAGREKSSLPKALGVTGDYQNEKPALITSGFPPESIEDPGENYREILDQWPEQDLPNAAKWIQEIADELVQAEAARHLLPRLLKTHPAAAAHLVISLSAEQGRGELLGQVMTIWAQNDWEAALAWGRKLPGERVKEESLIHLSYRWQEIDPRGAAAFAENLQGNTAQLLTTIASEWVKREPAAASAWALELPPGESRNKVLPSLLAAWSQSSPKDAAEFVASLPPDESQTQALISVVSGWAGQDPQTASFWISRFPESGLRAQAMEQLVTQWAGQDPETAGNWLQEIPRSKSRDAGVSVYCNLLASAHPESAFRWAETISDETLRNSQLELTGRHWLKANPEAAEEAIVQSSLPVQRKDHLLGQVR